MQTNGDDVGVWAWLTGAWDRLRGACRWLRGQARRLRGWLRHTPTTGMAYLRALLGKRVVSATTIATAALTATDAFRGSHDQLLLSARWWLILTVVGVMVAQFLVWRDLWIDKVEPAHGKKLYALAARLREQIANFDYPTYTDSGSFTPEDMFRAHFRSLAAAIDEYDQGLRDRYEAKQVSLAALEKAMPMRFLRGEGWYWVDIHDQCKAHLDGIVGGLDISVSGHGNLVWGTRVVYDGSDPHDAEAQLRTWLRELPDNPERVAFREADERAIGAQLSAIFRIDPLLERQPIRKARECKICFPPKERR